MATPFLMPQLGLDMKEGTVERWLKHEGDSVTRGEVIVEIETEKATVEVEAPASGVLRKIVVEEGSTVPVGEVIAVIAAADEELRGDIPSKGATVDAADKPAAIAEPAPAGATPSRVAAEAAPGPRGTVRASPRSRKVAEQHGVDIGLIQGTGPGGRIVQEDVDAYIRTQQHPAAAEKPAAPSKAAPAALPSAMRQAIARRMAQSKREIPHFYVSMTADMTQAFRFREEINEALGGELKVSVNDLVIGACARALERFPQFNAWYLDDALQLNEQINIGLAIALEDGLIAPAVLDCGNKTLQEIAAASGDLIRRAHSGSLKADEYSAATFTISNLGMYVVDTFTAIVNPPQVAILALGDATKQPVVRGDRMEIADLMTMTLSSDHRAVDGAGAAAFLAEIKGLLEVPWKLLQ